MDGQRGRGSTARRDMAIHDPSNRHARDGELGEQDGNGISSLTSSEYVVDSSSSSARQGREGALLQWALGSHAPHKDRRRAVDCNGFLPPAAAAAGAALPNTLLYPVHYWLPR